MAFPIRFNPFSLLDAFVETLPPTPFTTKLDTLLDKLTDKFETVKPVSLKNGVLSFNQNGDYTFEFLPNGKVKILLDGGHATVLTAKEWASVSTFNLAKADTDLHVSAALAAGKAITGPGDLSLANLSFIEADEAPGGRFEPSVNLDSLIGNWLSTRGVAATVDSLTVNGNKADAIKLVWDYLDDAYVAGGNYYDLDLNQAFLRLGVEYARYLDAGGAPLIDVVAKFAADGAGDADNLAERMQSMHDNLLGNIATASIQDRNFPDALETELLASVPQGYGERGVYGGYDEGYLGYGSANHDSARAFDYDRDWSRPDYIERSFGAVDALASQDTSGDGADESMYYGSGNSNVGFNLVRHEGAGVELALKAKQYGPNGGDYPSSAVSVDEDGTAHFQVSTGTETAASGTLRADWSIDYAATVLSQGLGDTFTFRLFIDTDETAGVDLQEIPMGTAAGLLQGSTNYAFFTGLIDVDDNAPGVQPYAFGNGEFTIELHAYDAGDQLLAMNRAVVHVSDAII